MSEFKIHTKITWRVDLTRDIQQLFYPSLVKKINKSNDFFNQNFFVSMHDVDEKLFIEQFFPLYEKEIVQRPDYHLDKDVVKDHILTNIRGKKEYKLFSLYIKKEEKFVGGILFHLEEDRISIALRVIERAVNQQYKKRTTVDFWFESQFVNHLVDYHIQYLFHGMDTYPRQDHEIGLALFKLQVGALPMISTHETEIKHYTPQQLKKLQPVVFFDDPDCEDFLKSFHLWHEEGQIAEEMLHSFESILSWTGVEFLINE